jgi:hypothetical protein
VYTLTISILANIALGVVLFGVLYRQREADTERLTGPEQALERYRIRYPRASGRVSLAADGRAALLELTDGTIGLVERCGRRWNVRVLQPTEILRIDRAGDRTICVHFADFGWPRTRVELSDPESCRRWIERLVAMRVAVASARGRKAHHA